MTSACELLRASRWKEQPLEKHIRIQLNVDPCSPDTIIHNLASIEGPIDVYCWYEGLQGLPTSGATFMKTAIFAPLYARKKDAKLYLYSLKAWDFKKNVLSMPLTTRLGSAINRIHTAAIECIYASSFFLYCKQKTQDEAFYSFISSELPKKKWLMKLSKHHPPSGMKVAALFDNQASLFDCIKDVDTSCAYACMQYVEGYYLIQESVKKGLSQGQKSIGIAFVLPNDESKYYVDLPHDIEKMLQIDFGQALIGVEITIMFQFFQYGDSLTSRPYIDKRRLAPKVDAEEICKYFDYLSLSPLDEESRVVCPRDLIHNLNERSL